METKIEGGYTRDERFAKEFFSYYSYKTPAGIAVTVICIAAIAVGLINIIAAQEYLSFISVALGIFLLILRCVRVKRTAKIMLDRDKEGNHGNYVVLQNLVTENCIVVKTSLNEAGLEYDMSCIVKVQRSRNYVYLTTKSRLAIVFDVKEFSKGTLEELIELMRDRGAKIKIKGSL